MCPRMEPLVNGQDTPVSAPVAGVNQPQIGLYDAALTKHILTLGEGNFSFSLALARALASASGLHFVSTSHESKNTVLETYPDSNRILKELNSFENVTVLHGVDATNTEQIKTLGCFDRVIWNFPCIRALRGKDGQNQEMELNKKLLNDFFANAVQILTPTGEVHVTHKTKNPFGQWGIANIAKTNKLHHRQSVVFDRCLYPGYTNKKVLSNGSFPIWDSLTYIFVPEVRAESESPADGGILEPITADIIKKLYLLLIPLPDDLLVKKKEKKRFKGSASYRRDDRRSKKSSAKDKYCQIWNSAHKVNNNKRKQNVLSRLEGRKRKKICSECPA